MSEGEQCEDAFFVACSRLQGVLYEHCQGHACLREQHVATRTLLRQTPLQHTCYALHAAPRIYYIAWPTSAALAPSPFICVVRIVRYQVVHYGRQPVFRIAQAHQDRTIDQSPFAAWSVCALQPWLCSAFFVHSGRHSSLPLFTDTPVLAPRVSRGAAVVMPLPWARPAAAVAE